MTPPQAHVTSSEPRPSVVLLSGMLGDESLWEGVVEGVAATHTVLCLRTDTAETVTEVAAAALELAPLSFALVGHSFGGVVALEMQRQAPARVKRIALLSASARPGSSEQQRSWSTLRSRVMAGEFADVARELAVATLGERHRSSGLVAHNLAMAESVGAGGLLRQLAAQTTRPDSRPGLARIAVPALVVMGEHDLVCPTALQHEVAAGVSGSAVSMMEGCGHMTPLEAPGEVAAVMGQWLSPGSSVRSSNSRTGSSGDNIPSDDKALS